MPFTTQSNKDLQLKRNEAKRKRTEKAEKAAAESALVRAERVKQRTQLLQTYDSYMEQSSSNLDLDNYNENRVDDALMEGCSSNFEIPHRHRHDGTFKELSNSTNVEYGCFLTNLNKKTALFLEGLLILSSKLGTNLINKQYEFKNIVEGLNCEEIKNEEMKNAILVHHKSAIILLKAKWSQIRWLNFLQELLI